MTEKEKMLAGEVYSAVDPELIEELMATREALHEYNSLRPSETRRMREILKGLFGHVADDEYIVNQPFRCDYGSQISIGKRFFANFNFVVLDEALVSIGDDCFIGPNVSIYTACHSTDPVQRNSRQEWAKPVTIGNNVWIGGSVTILPGVSIGDNVTIGAGSVVVSDIPAGTVAVGNPCKVIKQVHSLPRIVTYKPQYKQDFIRLNKRWIETYFRLEPSDLDTFAHIDDSIIGHGGQIFLAIDDSEQVVGCCALKPHPESDCYELAKMAVSPDAQGKGIGRKLGEALLDYARSHGAKRIFLEGNTRLEASIALYRKLGFKEIPLKNNAYERCDILMEILL